MTRFQTTIENNKMKYFIPILALVMMAWSCSPDESPEIKEALDVHAEMLELSSFLDSSITAEISRFQIAMADTLQTSDGGEALRVDNTMKNLVACQLALDEWRSTVVEIPGHHHHEPGEVCDHDHSQDAILAGLPDLEILQMQKDLLAALLSIQEKAAI
jgi:hypothetical protein